MDTKLKHFYKEKLGNNFHPYNYQLYVAEQLLAGKNIILQVPTGAGKTWASIIPFLYAQENQRTDFPTKMIYSLPLRTLTNSIYEDVKNICPASIQTGEYGEDPYFENDIIFSTIDQTLSNFLCFPLALSTRQANINAGALIGSYLVFDEFHLLDPKLSMATTIGMLKILGNLCRCCIMTATLSNDFMIALKDTLPNYTIINLDDFPDDKNKITSLLPRIAKKKIEVVKEIISAERIIKYHKRKSIIICNRVETAQKIYNDIITNQKKGTLKSIKTENIICLHARFFDKDRKLKEQKLKNFFGKKVDKNEEAILISTQVIEAGMDISCDVMHTEISPISSFLQRVGRCARFESELGQIYVYDLLELKEHELLKIDNLDLEDKAEVRRLNNKYLPYDNNLCLKTFTELKNVKTLDDPIPKQLIEKIIGDEEKLIIKQMYQSQGGGFNQNKIRESWETCEKNHYRSTIRDIQSVEITLITDDMCNYVAKYPYYLQSLGIFKWSLVGWLKKIKKGEGPILFDEEDWLIKVLEPNNIFDDLDNDESFGFKLSKITDFKRIPSQVYLNAKYFGYHEPFGFNWQYIYSFNNASPAKESKIKTEDFKPLTKDSFYQHNKGLIGAFEELFLSIKNGTPNKLAFIFNEFSKYLDIPLSIDFIKLIKTIIILHDYGKLNNAWQSPMQNYQAFKDNISFVNYNEILAHTDYDSKDDGDVNLGKKLKLNSRPSHAGVGAYVAQDLLFDNEFIKGAVVMSIARHHSPLTNSYPDFKINDKNYNEIKILFDEFDLDIKLEKNGNKGSALAFETGWHGERVLYLFLVRILRICDQKATENLNNYYNKTS